MLLDFWGYRMACVASPGVFTSPDGYAFILHEFVHCFQWETVESRLKLGLACFLAEQERARKCPHCGSRLSGYLEKCPSCGKGNEGCFGNGG
jgi:hypothetical protein